MSKNYNRAKASKCETGREIKLKVIYDQDPYPEECWHVWQKHKNKLRYHEIYGFQVRKYRTWKHNRKQQYKN